MSLPAPVPGLVIAYSYLWRNEARRGQEEGRKNRPCVIVLVVRTLGDRTEVTVAPVTHTSPARPEFAIEIPQATKQRLGLDSERSWIVIDDLNQFIWPGVDLRPVPGPGANYAYGLLPASLYRAARDMVLILARQGKAALTRRTE